MEQDSLPRLQLKIREHNGPDAPDAPGNWRSELADCDQKIEGPWATRDVAMAEAQVARDKCRRAGREVADEIQVIALIGAIDTPDDAAPEAAEPDERTRPYWEIDE